jgi:hypothetical protein
MKYVMTSHGPILFPDQVSHVMLKELEKFDVKILSAGFVSLRDKHLFDARTHGKAVSLGDMQPHEDDARTITSMLGDVSTLNMLIAFRNLESDDDNVER